MPGRLLHRIARRVCSRETDRVFEPLIADLQREWRDAAPSTRRGLALAGAYASFWSSLAACVATTVARGAVSPIDRRMTMPAIGAFGYALLGVMSLRIVGSLLGITGLRMFGNSWGYWHRPLSDIAVGELTTLGWSVMFATLPAFMYARREPSRRWNSTATRLLVGALLVSIVFVGWAGPALSGASKHAHGYSLDGRVQPAFASITTVVRMVRTHATDAPWALFLDRQLTMIADAFLLALIGWQLSAIRRPSIGRVAFWWFALMEFVLASGSYAINQAEWQQWRASGVLVLILLALHATTRRNRSDRPAPPALPDLPAPLSS